MLRIEHQHSSCTLSRPFFNLLGMFFPTLGPLTPPFSPFDPLFDPLFSGQNTFPRPITSAKHTQALLCIAMRRLAKGRIFLSTAIPFFRRRHLASVPPDWRACNICSPASCATLRVSACSPVSHASRPCARPWGPKRLDPVLARAPNF